MDTITLNIDGQEVKAKKGATVLEAALSAGIYVPILCYHPELKPSGSCRLCLVEIDGMRGLPTSCTVAATEGMVVRTNTGQVQQMRRSILEMILSEHPHACLTCVRKERCDPDGVCLRNVAVTERCVTCAKNKQCELQRLVDYIGISEVTLPYHYKGVPIDCDNPLFERDYNLCILCGRCVRACKELRGVGAIDFVHRGSKALIGTAFDRPLKEAGCRYCLACVEVCPTGALIDRGAKYKSIADKEAALVPCKHACPAHIDVPRYVNLIAEGKHDESLAVIREKVPFPAALGRVCIHPCEQVCRRGELNKHVQIKALKRFVADRDKGLWRERSKVAAPTGKSVAVVGAGPAGLTAAYYLAKLGHAVTVFESLPEPGGMMRVGIPEYRLPRDVLKSEIDEMIRVGVDIKTNARIESVDELFARGFSSVFLAVGAHQGMKMGVEGEKSPGVLDCAAFLRDVSLGRKTPVGNRVGVVGGGNAAIDAARTALRLGAKEVSIVYRRTRAEMPAAEEEIVAAVEEGVRLVFLSAPNKVVSDNNVVKLECLRMKLGSPDASGRRQPEPVAGSEYVMEFDTLIAAIGQRPDVPASFGVTIGKGNTIVADKNTLVTSRAGVFAGGDAVTGPASVIGAIAAGRKAASSIDIYLGGKGDIDEHLTPVTETSPYLGSQEGFAGEERVEVPCLPVEKRLDSFVEVESGFSEQMAVSEANRCLRCHLRMKICPVHAPPVTKRAEAHVEPVGAAR